MSLIVYLITDIIHVLNIVLLCDIFFRYKKRKLFYNKVSWIIAFISMMMVSTSIFLWDNDIVETVVYVIAICILLCCFYEDKIYNVIVSTLWIIVILGMLDTMSIVLIENASKIIGFSNGEVSRLFGAIVLCILMIILGRMYNKKYNRGMLTMGVGNLILFTLLTVVDTFIVMVIALVTIGEDQRVYKIVYFIAFILVILGLFLQLGAVILILMQRNVYKETQQLTARYLDDQTKHYEYLENRETETKKFRHDLRDHMDMLVSFAREHKYDEFDDYVEKIHTKVDKLGNAVSVQNSVVDAILNRYYSEAINNNVKMEVEGKFPVDCKIENYDICTIFSNLLRNALEATMKAEEKWISVGCRYTDKVIVVEIANSFDNKAGNGKSKAHKVDKNNHGFGLINVEESIEKYNGVWYREQEDNVYKVTISFIYARMEEKDEDSNN